MHKRLQLDKKAARVFLELLDDRTDRFTFQTFPDSWFPEPNSPPYTGPRYETIWQTCPDIWWPNGPPYPDMPQPLIQHATLDEIWPTLCEYNNKFHGIYVVVNATSFHVDEKGNHKCSADTVVEPRALFWDADGRVGYGGQDRIAVPVPFSCQIITSPALDPFAARQDERAPVSGRAQRLILIDGMSLAEWEEYQQLVPTWPRNYEFLLPKQDRDRCRPLRLPGTYHVKNPALPRPVVMSPGASGTVWGRDEIIERFELLRQRARYDGAFRYLFA